jgi:hypothetical protein
VHAMRRGRHSDVRVQRKQRPPASKRNAEQGPSWEYHSATGAEFANLLESCSRRSSRRGRKDPTRPRSQRRPASPRGTILSPGSSGDSLRPFCGRHKILPYFYGSAQLDCLDLEVRGAAGCKARC